MDKIEVKKDYDYIDYLKESLDNPKNLSTWDLFNMAYHVEKTFLKDSFSRLTALKYLPNMSFLPHQKKTAENVIERMAGRAILADEVGLGKTIEAGLILKEYMIRGLVNKVLILVPASLIQQWVQELQNKFYIQAVAYRKNMSWEAENVIVASLDTAKKEPHKSEILKIKYDFLIVDEAHRLKNEKTLNYQFVSNIKKLYCLLLTATPIQNNLIEIFNLISIIRPGLLGNYDDFIRKYGKKQERIYDHKYLRELIRNNLIRNTRENTRLNSFERNIQNLWVHFSKEEQTVYNQIQNTTKANNSFTKTMFLRQLCSSREACYLSLKKYYEKENCQQTKKIYKQIETLPQHRKALEVLKLIKQLENEKVIIFTEFVPTQYYLQWFLKENGISSVLYNGEYSKSKKDWMIQLFKNHAQVLIATEAGSEGINLQFCNHLINYDLPWNPMKLEQRIGRIHRFGQTKDVQIYNIILENTIEQQVMKLLYEKLKLFTTVIGNLERILINLDINNLETEIEKIIEESKSDKEMEIKLNNLASVIDANQKNIL